MTITRNISGHDFIFHPSGAMFWPEQKMLLIADVHFGKVSHFREADFAVPPEPAEKNFEKLDAVAAFFQPQIICFLGDLFHNEINGEWDLFENWVNETQAAVLLVAGNHDIIAPDKYEEIGVRIFEDMTIGDFYLTHQPKEHERTFNLCGHIHPAVRLHGAGKQWLTLPCFFHKPHQLILPAFGQFTGNYVMKPSAQDCVYAIAKEEVIVICEV